MLSTKLISSYVLIPSLIVFALCCFSIISDSDASQGALLPEPVKHLKVAVASNFVPTLKQIARLYNQQNEQKIIIINGSSGKHVAQINHGAQFDLFLSADTQRAQAVEQFTHVSTLDRKPYSRGVLAWACLEPCSRYGISDNKPPSIKQLATLSLAIANPKLAPYGSAAKDFIKKLKLHPARLIRAENIRQTLQYLVSKNVDLALVAYSNAKAHFSSNEAHFQRISPSKYPVIEQQMVLLTPGGKEFFDFILAPESQRLISNSGYLPVE